MIIAQQTTSNTERPATPLMLPPRRAAAALGLTEYTVRQWMLTGFATFVLAGRKQLINVDSLRRKLNAL